MAVTVILDSNMLMATRKLRLDIFTEIERLVKTNVKFSTTTTVIEELKRLQERGGDVASDAAFALRQAEKCAVIQAPAGGPCDSVDESIIRTATESLAVVATADAELRKKLRNAKIPVICVREKSKLTIEGLEAAYY